MTIYDISKLTGFSPPTVSKALNGTGAISAKTRKRIIAVADEMGYEPNITARALRTRRSSLIGVLNDIFYRPYDFISPFFSAIMSGFQESVHAENYDLLLISSVAQVGQEMGRGKYRHIDGILILAMGTEEKALTQFRSYNIPCVSSNNTFPGVSTVVSDNRGGARTAVQHLVDLGHREIAYLAGPVTKVSLAARERRQGYRDILARKNIRANPDLEVSSDTWHVGGGYRACAELLSRKVRFSALFTASNYLAIGAMRYMAERGIQIPGDVSVIGFEDGDGLEEYITPSLSTMKQDAVQIGRTAAAMLLQKMKGLSTEKTIRIPTRLVHRESSAAI